MSQNLCTVGQKAAVKDYHAEETLQLFYILKGWAIFYFGGVIGRGGRSCRRNGVSKNFKRRCCENTFFKVNGKTIGGQGVEKASRWQRCVCLSGDPTRESSMYANTPSKPSVVRSIILWKVCAALESPNGVNKYSKRPKGVMIAIFGMSAVATGIW